MVSDVNKQLQVINKIITSFIAGTSSLSEEVKETLLEEWKRGGKQKLRECIKKSGTVVPKRVSSKYIYFCDDERPKIFQDNPDMDIKKCTCELGRRWRIFKEEPLVDPERMARYQAMFEADKQRYDNEKLVESEPVVKRALPKSQYHVYCKAQRLENPKISMKQLGIQWAAVKNEPEELAKYIVT